MNRFALSSVRTAFAALGLAGLASVASSQGSTDTLHLTDEPGNWFRSEATGTPVTIVDAGRPRRLQDQQLLHQHAPHGDAAGQAGRLGS